MTSDRPWPSRPTVPVAVAEAAGAVAAAVEHAARWVAKAPTVRAILAPRRWPR